MPKALEMDFSARVNLLIHELEPDEYKDNKKTSFIIDHPEWIYNDLEVFLLSGEAKIL